MFYIVLKSSKLINSVKIPLETFSTVRSICVHIETFYYRFIIIIYFKIISLKGQINLFFRN